MRHEFTRKVRAAAYERAAGRCEGRVTYDGELRRCPLMLYPGHYHYDHIDPDFISGRNDLANCQVLCDLCHALKTQNDQRTIAKVKRVRDKHTGAKRSRWVIPGSKRSRLKKHMSGKVSLRW